MNGKARWRVYYDDGSTWDWTRGLNGIPTNGVIVVLQKTMFHDSRGHEVDKYHTVHGCPYYMHADGEWLHAYADDIIDRLANRRPIDIVLIGRMVTKYCFGKVHAQATQDLKAENLL